MKLYPAIAETTAAFHRSHFPWIAASLLAAVITCFAGIEYPRLMWDNTTFRQLEVSSLPAGISSYGVQYPRLAQCTNGDLMVFVHSDTNQAGLYGGDLLCKRSLDAGLAWNSQWTVVRQRGSRTFAGQGIYAVYANPSPTVLRDGTVLLAYQVRNADPMTDQNTGIEVLLSRDNGLTWAGPYLSFRGMNWEPVALQTPAEIQMHFTKISASPSQMGLQLTRSVDGGLNWAADAGSALWNGRLISRTQTTYPTNGWNSGNTADGMPAPLWMNGGAGILVAMESLGCREAPQLVWSSILSNWNYTPFAFGPEAARKWTMNTNFYGYAPFLQQFPAPQSDILCLANGGFIARDGSGGPIIQANGEPQRVDDGVWVFVGDAAGRNFTNWSQPFLKRGGYWGSLRLGASSLTSNTVFAAATSQYFSGLQNRTGAGFIQGRVLRRMDCPMATPVIDGIVDTPALLDSGILISGLDGYQWVDGSWPEGAGSRLNGTPSTSRLRLCTTWNATNLCISAQIQTTNIRSADGFTIRLDPQNSSSTGLVSGLLEVEWQPSSTLTARRYNGVFWSGVSNSGWLRSARLAGTLDNSSDSDTGYVLEVAIPWTAVGSHQSTMAIHCEFRDAQLPADFSGIRALEGSIAGNPSTWLPIALISPAPVITCDPASQEALPGDDATFSLSATGSSPLAYQWFFAGAPLPGQTNNVMVQSSVTTNQAGSYFCVVTNPAGSTTSAVATLSLNVCGLLRNGGFESNGGEGTIPAGWRVITNSYGAYSEAHHSGDFSLHAGANGGSGGDYQDIATTAGQACQLQFWAAPFSAAGESGRVQAGTPASNSSSLLLNNNAEYLNQVFVVGSNWTCFTWQFTPTSAVTRVSFQNIAPSAVSIDDVSVIPVTPLSIVSPPQNLQVFSGDTADFSVTATGGAPLVYQWYCSGSPLAGQTASSLRLVTVNTNQAGAYSVAVSNSCGRATNVSASLAVDVWELLRNGGFEANVGNGAIPTSWSLITNSYGAYSGLHHGGSWCMHAGASGGNGGESQDTATVPGRMYRISFWAAPFAGAGESGKVQAGTPGANSSSLSLNNKAEYLNRTFVVGAGWTFFSYLFTPTSATTRISFQNIAPSAVSIDDASLVYVVNTNPPILTAQAADSLIALAWPADHTGWQLQAQTNGPDTGLSTNWFRVPGSTATNSWVLPLYSPCSSVFYRLKLY